MKQFMKNSVGLLVSVPVLGATLGMIGNAGMPGGLGGATQTVLSGGFLGHVASKFKW